MKKSFVVLMSIVMLFAMSQSVAAYLGFADTKDYAIPRYFGQDYVGHIDDPEDVDWLKYTNTYSSVTYADIFVMPLPGGSAINYDLDVEYCDTTGYCFPVAVADTGAGVVERISDLYVPPGYTIYWKVSGHTSLDYGSDYATALHG